MIAHYLAEERLSLRCLLKTSPCHSSTQSRNSLFSRRIPRYAPTKRNHHHQFECNDRKVACKIDNEVHRCHLVSLFDSTFYL